MIGLALSGGGSRAIAFHLGCLRALQDRDILSKVSVLSTVSGGSVIGGLYAYSDDSFGEFDRKVVNLLSRGLERRIVIKLLFSPTLLARVVATNVISSPVAAVASLLGCNPPFRRWASRTDALEAALEGVVGDIRLKEVKRPGLDVIINACELRTGTAFRFSNKRSGSWRGGEIEGNEISVAHAVASSAAYPIFLPAFDRSYTFVKECEPPQQRRVVLTDGGVYDNLGISCLEPGRDLKFSLFTYSLDYIICCDASDGQFDGKRIPYFFLSRTEAAFESIFRKVQDAAISRLYSYKQSGQIKGFALPYLGQLDSSLPFPVPNLVPREAVCGYPTNFAAMDPNDIERLALRGEQLTRALLKFHTPEL
jgi:NTE family protein